MNPEFWHDKWERNEIGFHLKQIHPLVIKYLSAEKLEDVSKVFVPLCGKTMDIGYLLEQGKQVVANELSEAAVKQLFADLSLTPNVTPWQGGQCYQAENLTVWVGDYFELTHSEVSDIDLIYDRAALIALPEEMRKSYVQHMLTLAPKAKQLLLTLTYNQAEMAGPPFSVSEAEVKIHYADTKQIQCLSQKDVIEYEPKFAGRGLKSLVESAYWLD